MVCVISCKHIFSFNVYNSFFVVQHMHIVSTVVGEQFDPNSDFRIIDHIMFEVPIEFLKDTILNFEKSDQFFLEITGPEEITDCRLAFEVKQACNISYLSIYKKAENFMKHYSAVFQKLLKLLTASNLSFLLSTNRSDEILNRVDCIRVVQLSVEQMIQMSGSKYPDSKLQKKFTMALESIFPQRGDDCIIKNMIANRLRNIRRREKIAVKRMNESPVKGDDDDGSARDDDQFSNESDDEKIPESSKIDVEDFIRTQTIRLGRDEDNNIDIDDEVISIFNSSGESN